MKYMKIIISPAKKMRIDDDFFSKGSQPQLLERSKEILDFLKSRTQAELKSIWKCSDKLLEQSTLQLEKFDFKNSVTPSIFAYNGIQYQYLSPSSLTDDELNFLNSRLCIISAVYGVLQPFDLVSPYRLEMQATIQINNNTTLYDFWGTALAQLVEKDAHSVINLASEEYSKAILPYIKNIPTITCTFAEETSKGIKEKATLCKMARGEMTRFIAQNKLDTVDKLKEFKNLGFSFSKTYSTEKNLVFVKSSDKNPSL